MRILLVTQYLGLGGLESMVIDLSCQLVKMGCEVHVLVFNEIDENYIGDLRENNIDVHVIPLKSRLDLCFYKKVVGFIRQHNFDVIHAHSGCHFNAAVFSRIAGIKNYIYTAHGMLIYTRLIDRIEDSFSGFLTSHLISVSAEIECTMKKWLVAPRCQFNTIINGIDAEKFKPIIDIASRNTLLKKYHLPDDKILFGSVGRLVPVKNYSMALRAVKHLVDSRIKNICFILVGTGGEYQNLKGLAEELGITEYVLFLGMQYHIHEILPLFRFFVLSSFTEGTSISLLESQACGIPAVVSNVGGNAAIIVHKKNGYLCASNDDEVMAGYMKTLINHPSQAAKMGENGRERVGKYFSIAVMAGKYLHVYQDKK